MKRQSVGIVLCALLLTTFGHELLNRHHAAHSARIDHAQARSPLASRSKPAGNETCEWKCVPINTTDPTGSNANLTIYVNVTTHIVALVNLTAHISIVVDVDANLTAVFNATANSVIIVDLRTQSGIVVSVTGSWTNSETFAAFVNGQNLTALSNGKGQKFDQSNITEEISVRLQAALVLLGESSTTAKEALGVIIQVGFSLATSWRVIWAVFSVTLVSVRITLSTFVIQIQALAHTVLSSQIGVDFLVKHKVVFSLEVILTAKSSLVIVGYLWTTIAAAGINLKQVIGSWVDSNLNISIELASLGGNSTDGPNGVLNIIKYVVLFVHGKITIDVLIVALVKYYSANNNNEKLGEELREGVDGLLNVIKQLKLTTYLKVLVKLLVDIKEHKWIENKVNMSVIITILIETKQSAPLSAIIRILVALSAVITIEVAVGQLLLYCVQLLAVHGGLLIILILIPDLQIDGAIIIDGSVSVLHQIVLNVTITELLSGNLFKILSGLAVIGNILRALDVALKIAGIKFTLEVLLGRPHCSRLLKGILELLLKAVKSSECEHGPIGPIIVGGHGPVILGTPSGEGNGTTTIESGGITTTEAIDSTPPEITGGESSSGVPESTSTEPTSSAEPITEERHHGKASGKHHGEHKYIKGKHYSHEKQNAAV